LTSLYSVAFTDASHGWAVGNWGTIVRTTDAGVYWLSQASGVSTSLYSVTFTDASHGWAVGEGGTILRTTDAGVHWTRQASGTTSTLFSVAFVDRQRGWAVGDGGIILRTADSGAHWSVQVGPYGVDVAPLRFVACAGTSQVWAVGGAGTVLRYGKPFPGVGTPSAPSRMSHSSHYTMSGFIDEWHPTGARAVRIYKYRYVSGRWRSYGYETARISQTADYYTKYSRSIRLPYRGKWRVRAYAPEDTWHAAQWSSGYDDITVY
jgi:hypothetical protein